MNNAPIVYAPGLDEETVGQAVIVAARLAVRMRLHWTRALGMSSMDFRQEIAVRIVRRVAAFVPKMRKNGRMMRLDEYAYVAACFALLDILGARTDSNARKVDALDAPRLGLGARVDVKLIDELRRAPRDPDEPVRDCGRRWRQRRARFTRLGRKQAAAWKRWRECLQPVPGHGAIAVETEELHGKSLEEAA